MVPPVVTKNTSKSKSKSSKQQLSTTKPTSASKRDTTETFPDSSSEDSDETIVQAELCKQMNVPRDLIYSGGKEVEEAANSSDDEFEEVLSSNVSNVSTDVEIDKSFSKSPSKSISPTQRIPAGYSPPCTQTQPSSTSVQQVYQSPPVSPSQALIDEQTVAHSTTASAPDIDINSVPMSVRLQIEQDLLNRIDHTARLKKALDKEIKFRKKQSKARKVHFEIDQVATGDHLDYKATTDNTVAVKPTVVSSELAIQSKQLGSTVLPKIPRLTSLDMSVIKKAVRSVAKRRRLSNSYSILSEILAVKQILAKGNPFVIIPQHAYNIANVPGVRLPHIQRLLQQWQTYFSNLLYQIVQIEYSLEYSDVERRINLMIEGDFEALCQFQELIGKDEITSSNFKFKSSTSTSNIVEIPSGDPSKKARTSTVSDPAEATTSNSAKKPRQPLLEAPPV